MAKINSAGSALTFSTYLGGASSDGGGGITVDSSNNVYVTGFTASTDFPTVNPIQGSIAGSDDVFVTKFNSSGSALPTPPTWEAPHFNNLLKLRWTPLEIFTSVDKLLPRIFLR